MSRTTRWSAITFAVVVLASVGLVAADRLPAGPPATGLRAQPLRD